MKQSIANENGKYWPMATRVGLVEQTPKAQEWDGVKRRSNDVSTSRMIKTVIMVVISLLALTSFIKA